MNINYKGNLFELLQKYYLNSFDQRIHIKFETIQNSYTGKFQTIIELVDYILDDNIFVGEFKNNKKEAEQRYLIYIYIS
jgi:hypothetical protein